MISKRVVSFKNAAGAPASGGVPEAVLKALGDLTGTVEQKTAAAIALAEGLGVRLDRLEGRADRMGESGGPTALAITKTLVDSAGFASLKAGQPSSGRIALPGSFNAIRKALTSTQAGGSPNNGFDVAPQRGDTIGEDPRRSLALLDVLPHLPVTSNVFEFMTLDNYTAGAAVQTSEGSVKAETNVPLTLQSSRIQTVAHFLKASRQVLDDVPALGLYLNGLMNFGVRAKLEQLIVNATLSSGGFSGLLDAALLFAPSGTTKAADAISQAAAALEQLGYAAGLVILNPTDWSRIRTERSASTSEYVAGTWAAPSPPSIWGIPVVTTASLAAGTVLVIDPSAVVVLDRQQATVQAGYDADDFTRNLVTLLGEMRGSLAVLSNGGVLKFTPTF